MGGGADSRIPSILNEIFASEGTDIVVRTYDFNPDIASGQIESWIAELSPSIIIGESLGSLHALECSSAHDLPCILISPALNAPLYFGFLSWLTLVPGVTSILDRIYRPKSGDRQEIHFTHRLMCLYPPYRKRAMRAAMESRKRDTAPLLLAFFGLKDHYRRSGIVCIRTWKRYFGADTYKTYNGTHFMEEDSVRTVVADAIRSIL